MLGAGELSVSQRIQWWRWTQGRLLELGTGKWGHRRMVGRQEI